MIIKQDSETWNHVFLILAGYCDVIHHDGEQFATLGTREAGDLMGEMAVVTGTMKRLIAESPQLNYALRRYRAACNHPLPWVITASDAN